jgi:molybdopterin synthase catalytic subunit
MTMAFLTPDPIDLSPLAAAVQSPERGAIASFLGVVRNHHGDRPVERLHYSAYGPMAEAECERIVEEAESRWQVAVALRHRTGRLEVGETAVAIVAASAHRDEAFAACRWIIEAVKRRVPIWKQEFYADGSVAWVDPTSAGAVPLDTTAQPV